MEHVPGSNDPGTPASRTRRRPTRSSEQLSRFRERESHTNADALQGLQWAAARMAETNSMLDDSNPHLRSSGRTYQDYSAMDPQANRSAVEAQVNRWRAKRRKLDSDDRREGVRGFNYGHYGQVVPGPLKMEIVSCDGGTYSEPNGDSSWPENVLLNDTSVYCTQSDRCNLILRHQGETPFCLKKIVIRAPKTGFDAP